MNDDRNIPWKKKNFKKSSVIAFIRIQATLC